MSIYPLLLADALAHQVDQSQVDETLVQAIVEAKRQAEVAGDRTEYEALWQQVINADNWATALATHAALEVAGLADPLDPAHWTCPCCGRASSPLVDCDWCEWEMPEDNEATRQTLDQVQPGAGHNACIGHGCMVCLECRDVFFGHPETCPVQVLSDLVACSFRPQFQGDDPIAALVAALQAAWPHPDEAVEEYRTRVFEAAVRRTRETYEVPKQQMDEGGGP